jgi:hypothetical protein
VNAPKDLPPQHWPELDKVFYDRTTAYTVGPGNVQRVIDMLVDDLQDALRADVTKRYGRFICADPDCLKPATQLTKAIGRDCACAWSLGWVGVQGCDDHIARLRESYSCPNCGKPVRSSEPVRIT